MRFIQCARHVNEQNLYAFQYCGNIFYRAFKEVPPGTELLVWYDEKYPQFLGIPLGIQDYEFFRESGKAVLIFQFTLKKIFLIFNNGLKENWLMFQLRMICKVLFSSKSN